MSHEIETIKQKITPILKQAGVLRSSVFGSVARGESKDISQRAIQSLIKFKVLLVYKFGSQAENLAGPLSDFDIAVLMDSSVNLVNKNSLYQELYGIFTQEFNGKSLDIVFLNTAGCELKFDVVNHGRIVFEYSSQDRLNFEEQTVLEYADFKPLLKEFNQAILARI